MQDFKSGFTFNWVVKFNFNRIRPYKLDSHPINFQFSMRVGGTYYLLFIMDGG